jgi:hypothetical protein
MRGSEATAMLFFGYFQKITLALLGDHNFGIRIGSKGWVGRAWT